jgi:hypothetical protein
MSMMSLAGHLAENEFSSNISIPSNADIGSLKARAQRPAFMIGDA